jgi:hypothetical protein
MGSIQRITEKSSAYPITVQDEVIVCTGTFTVTLPSAVGITGKQYEIKSKSGVVTVATTASQTIDGNASMSVPAQSNMSVVSDGTVWRII